MYTYLLYIYVYILIHLLYIFSTQGLTVLGTFLPDLLPDWPSDNVALWLSLAEGLILPMALGLCDQIFSQAAGASCARENTRSARYQGKKSRNKKLL